MKLLFAPDSFKGSLSSNRAIELLTETAIRHFPGCEITGVPMADGGEGTVEALLDALDGHYETCTVTDPLGEPVSARYGLTANHTAIIEMAAASGLPLVPDNQRNPLYTTTYGTGELIKDALSKGATHLLLSIGGSATNDGEMGASKALGIRFYNENDCELDGFGKNLIHIKRIDTTNLLPSLKKTSITIMCDVKNPLTGPTGSTYIYGPQKGGTSEILDELEQGMLHYRRLIKEMAGTDYGVLEGSGAAGGFAIPFLAFANARLASGIDSVLSTLHFDESLEGVDFVVTGEGRVDEQSAYGKVMAGVGQTCAKKNIPVAAIVGGIEKGADKVFDFGIDSIFPIVPGPMALTESMARSEELFKDAADRMFRFIKMGIKLRTK